MVANHQSNIESLQSSSSLNYNSYVRTETHDTAFSRRLLLIAFTAGGPCVLVIYRLANQSSITLLPSIILLCCKILGTNSVQLGRISNADQSRLAVLPIFLVLSCTVLLCYRVCMHRRVQCHSKDPKTWPLLGSQLEAARNYDRLIDWITDFFRDGHRTVKMSFLFRRSYLTVDPANVEYILKTNFQNYPKGQESHHRLFDLLGNGILNTDGSVWKTHRKLASLEFSIKKLRHLTSTVYKSHALKLVEVLIAESDQSQARGVDMQELLLSMTFNSICEVVFGSAVVESGVFNEASIASALDNVQEMITRRYVFPWWRMQKFLNVGSERVLRQDITRFNTFLTNVINHKRLERQEDADGAQDLLSRFLSHQETTACAASSRAYTGHNKEDRDEAMLVQEVRDAMMSFVMAGRDTTASTLSWFLYSMCTHPDKQEKVFHELKELESRTKLCNDGAKTADHMKHESAASGGINNTTIKEHMREFAEKVLSYEALGGSSTPYLHAALAETLRLYPAVPRDGKVALNDDILPDGTHIKAGDQVAYIPYAMGRMPFLWGSDALVFKPERWLENGTFQPQSPFKFTAFQAGPRMCLGKDAAYLQMKITAAMLLRFFRFQLAPNHPVIYRMMMVMTMKHGLRVIVTPR